MYQYKDTLNEYFFRFDKKLIREKIWARLPLASKSIFPVIGVYCDSKGIAFPSEQTIAILTGCTEKTVREGLKGLSNLIGIEHYITARGHIANKYHYPIPPRKKGRVFFFHKNIIEGGNWSKLSQSAQSLYPVIKHFSFFDYESYLIYEDEDNTYTQSLSDIAYDYRKYDFCEADIDILCEFAGIGSSTVYAAIVSLEKNFLIEKTEPLNGYPTWKVYVKPPNIFKRECLNEQIKRRYVTQNLPTR